MKKPHHAGTLITDVLENHSLSINKTVTALAKHIRVKRSTLSRVIHGKTLVSAELALRLQEALGIDAGRCLEMQFQRQLWIARRKKRVRVARLAPAKAV